MAETAEVPRWEEEIGVGERNREDLSPVPVLSQCQKTVGLSLSVMCFPLH